MTLASLGRAEITKSRPSTPPLRIFFLLVSPHIFHLSRLLYLVVHLDMKFSLSHSNRDDIRRGVGLTSEGGVTKSRPSSPSVRIFFLLVSPNIFHVSRLPYYLVYLDKKFGLSHSNRANVRSERSWG